jgi:hypothetical protein
VAVPRVRDRVFASAPSRFNGDLGIKPDSPGAQRRKAFADWLVDSNNPLTTRVMANRMWHHIFGSDPSGGNCITNWDSHSDILKTHAMQAEIMDQPTAALIADLKQRGMLEHTLVVWCTEFGRMLFLQANGTGRDHNRATFTCFLAGAGVKKGYSYGESDELGFKAAVSETSVYDFNAALLYLMGLHHETLTYYHDCLERRLTNVHGHVIQDILA